MSVARCRTVSKAVPAGFSAARFALAFARLTNETPIRTLTVEPPANVTYAPDPRPAGGQPSVPYVVPPLLVGEPAVRGPSFPLPVAGEGWADSAWKDSG